MADVKVEAVMTRDVVALKSTTSVHEAAQTLANNCVSGAPVTDNGRVVGVIAESDLIAAAMPPAHVDRGPSTLDVLATFITGRPHPRKDPSSVGEYMSPYVISISPDESIWRAAAVMERHGIKRLPVTLSDGLLIGIVSRADLVRAMAITDESLVEDVTGSIRVLGQETIPDLQVDANEGFVTIRGTADRRSTHDIAIRIASRTPGVLGVTDHLGYEIDDSHPARIQLDQDPRVDRYGRTGLDRNSA